MNNNKDLRKVFTIVGALLGIVAVISCLSRNNDSLEVIIGNILIGFVPFGIYLLHLRLESNEIWSIGRHVGSLLGVTLPQIWLHYNLIKYPQAAMLFGILIGILWIFTFPLILLGGWVGAIISKERKETLSAASIPLRRTLMRYGFLVLGFIHLHTCYSMIRSYFLLKQMGKVYSFGFYSLIYPVLAVSSFFIAWKYNQIKCWMRITVFALNLVFILYPIIKLLLQFGIK